MSSTITGIRIVDMPDLGVVTDGSSFVGEHAGSGRFAATALGSYMQPAVNAAAAAAVTPAYNNVGRNLAHNGTFDVQQRGTGTWTASGYTADRWSHYINLDTVATQLYGLADSERAAIGDEAATSALLCNFTGSATAGAFTTLYQPVEDVRRLAGKTVTISLWAWTVGGNANLGISLDQRFGTGGSGQVFTPQQTILISPGPTRYSATFGVPSVAGKTVGAGSLTDLNLIFSQTGGPLGRQTGTFAIWGVQLELGSVMTPLDKAYDVGTDLRNCQRFYQRNIVLNAAFQASAGGQSYGVGVMLPINMRATPTLSLINNNNVNLGTPTLFNTSSRAVAGNAQSVAAGAAVFSVNIDATADL